MRAVSERIHVAVVMLAAVLLARSTPPWPDGWDGLGFIASITRFDLDHFSPHPPGYPVYVALLRVMSWFIRNPTSAANAVAVVSSVVALATLRVALKPSLDPRYGPYASTWVMVAALVCPLTWRCASAIGSEAPALACVGIATFGLSRRSARGAIVVGIAVGLGVGVRASWAPLFLAAMLLVPGPWRRRAWFCALFATLAWAIPLVAIVGPGHLLSLSESHLVGHATRWGGTAWTEPSRLRYLMRDIFVDGMGAGDDALGVAIGVAGAAAVGLALMAWRRASFRSARIVVLAIGPYLVWIAVGQNLRQEPRHALPIVVALAVFLGLAAIVDRRARVPVIAFFVLASLRTMIDTRDRLDIPPPGAQLVALVRALPGRESVAVFGGASVRYFEPTELHARARTAGTMGDVVTELARFDRLPTRVLATDEIEDAPAQRLPPLAVFSRPPRIDRKSSPLTVYDVSAALARGRL